MSKTLNRHGPGRSDYGIAMRKFERNFFSLLYISGRESDDCVSCHISD